MKPAHLHAVETVQEPAPEEEPLPSTEYEWRERQHVLTRDWSRVHTTADKRQPLPVWVQARRTWAK